MGKPARVPGIGADATMDHFHTGFVPGCTSGTDTTAPRAAGMCWWVLIGKSFTAFQP